MSRVKKVIPIVLVTAIMAGLLYKELTKEKVQVEPPFIGMGGTMSLRYPYNETINSFREWDHYHEPGTGEPDTLPAHRFWTWGKMNRPAQFPVGECMPGTWQQPHTQETLDGIFECDRPIIDDVLNRHEGAMHQVGNEINYYPYISPTDYAYQFGLYEQHIHSVDPTSMMMNGGLALFTGWESWTSEFIQEYQQLHGTKPPVDVWVIHPYAFGWPDGLAAATAGIEYTEQFRGFLDVNEYADTPIIIGEFSDASGHCSEYELVQYAKKFCDWIVANQDTENIIGWYWWGSSSVAMGNAGLFDADRNITQVGEAYIAHCGVSKHKIYLPLIVR